LLRLVHDEMLSAAKASFSGWLCTQVRIVNAVSACPSHAEMRLPDKLAMEFRDELLEAWEVDSRNLVYADEGDPLDVYRTILRIDDLRRPVFESNGGSTIIVSPTGSKLMALGSLMACIERDVPVAYLEAEAYEMDNDATLPEDNPTLVHLWLEGEAYLNNRPALRRGLDK
jgi:hypothetical protein